MLNLLVLIWKLSGEISSSSSFIAFIERYKKSLDYSESRADTIPFTGKPIGRLFSDQVGSLL